MTQTADVKTHQFESHSGKETIAIGHRIAELLTPPKFLILRGDLGAGKTTPVSYTHLDVYKRQVHGLARVRRDAPFDYHRLCR